MQDNPIFRLTHLYNILTSGYPQQPYPLSQLLRQSKENSLGSVNPTPWATTFFSYGLWIVYALITNDILYFFWVLPGFLVNFYYVLSAVTMNGKHNVMYEGSKFARISSFEVLVLSVLTITVSFAAIQVFAFPDKAKVLWGNISNIVCILNYCAPFSRVVKMINDKDSSSILVPYAIANTMNAIFITLYGVALKDMNLIMSAALGALLGLIQLLVAAVFERKEEKRGNSAAALKGERRQDPVTYDLEVGVLTEKRNDKSKTTL